LDQLISEEEEWNLNPRTLKKLILTALSSPLLLDLDQLISEEEGK